MVLNSYALKLKNIFYTHLKCITKKKTVLIGFASQLKLLQKPAYFDFRMTNCKNEVDNFCSYSQGQTNIFSDGLISSKINFYLWIWIFVRRIHFVANKWQQRCEKISFKIFGYENLSNNDGNENFAHHWIATTKLPTLGFLSNKIAFRKERFGMDLTAEASRKTTDACKIKEVIMSRLVPIN